MSCELEYKFHLGNKSGINCADSLCFNYQTFGVFSKQEIWLFSAITTTVAVDLFLLYVDFLGTMLWMKYY